MSDHHGRRPHDRSTGAVDKDRADPGSKMDRELRNTDSTGVNDRDRRGMGRQAVEQQEREQDFDQIDRDLSADSAVDDDS
ncbi:MAG: hypothetical protein WEB52_04655 [Dehalococcoidia bacterium]